MSYLTFGILTNNPATVRDFLIARGILEQVDNGEGGTALQGVHPGLEWLEIPNSIRTGGSGTEADPYTYDTKRLFILKFAHDMKADEQDGEEENDEEGNRRSIFLRTKIGKWVQAHSSAFTYTEPGAGGRTFTGRKVTGEQTYLINEESTALLHAWQ